MPENSPPQFCNFSSLLGARWSLSSPLSLCDTRPVIAGFEWNEVASYAQCERADSMSKKFKIFNIIESNGVCWLLYHIHERWERETEIFSSIFRIVCVLFAQHSEVVTTQKLPLDSNMWRDIYVDGKLVESRLNKWEKTHHKKTMMIIVGILRVSNPAPKRNPSFIHERI